MDQSHDAEAPQPDLPTRAWALPGPQPLTRALAAVCLAAVLLAPSAGSVTIGPGPALAPPALPALHEWLGFSGPGSEPEEVVAALATAPALLPAVAAVLEKRWNGAEAVAASSEWQAPGAILAAARNAVGAAPAPCPAWEPVCLDPVAAWRDPPFAGAAPAFPATGVSLRQAALDLLGAATDEEQADLARLDEVPEPAASALAAVLVAFADVLAVSAIAACPGINGAACDARQASPNALAAARDALAASVLLAVPSLAPLDLDPVERPPLLSLHFRDEPTTHGRDVLVSIDLGGDDTYTNNAGGSMAVGAVGSIPANAPALAIDLAGDDAYLGWRSGNGAVNGGGAGAVGLLVDCHGDDTYDGGVEGRGAVNGGGTDYGAGGLFDLAGNDAFLGSSGDTGAVNGAGYLGSGLLFDQGGNDVYQATAGGRGAANGGAALGSGILVDLDGNDVYDASLGGQGAANGGSWDGAGFLLDGGGDDAYGGSVAAGGINGASAVGSAILMDLAGDDTYSGTAAGSGAVNGATMGGHGVLIDLRGHDAYQGAVRNGGINGGALTGNALLYDGGGDDVYNGTISDTGGINGAAKVGEGTLIDAAGDDAYGGRVLRFGGVNGASQAGSGLLLDQGGDDAYWGDVGIAGGVNGATTQGVAILVDSGGTNRFTALTGLQGASNGAAAGVLVEELLVLASGVGYAGGLGILITGPGDDHHRGSGVTQGAGDIYGVGILVDTGGSNTYRAQDARAAQGAGAHFGTGILADLGSNAQFWLDGDGQGAGVQGIGILWRPQLPGQPDPATSLVAASGSRPGITIGAGLGLRILDGPTEVAGVRPDLECAGEEFRGSPLTLSDVTLRLCQPHDSSRVPIVDPLTGEPVGNVSKPPIDCAASVQAAPACVLAATLLLGTAGPGWFASSEVAASTSGGLAISFHRLPNGGLIGLARYEMHSADHAGCGYTCEFTTATANWLEEVGVPVP